MIEPAVPREAGRPPIDFEILRDGDVVLVSEPLAAAARARADPETWAAFGE